MTGSSTSSHSQAEHVRSAEVSLVEGRAPTAVIACGALGAAIREIVSRRGWDIELHLLAPLLHNHPREIAPTAETLARSLRAAGQAVVLAYADCGSYGALDELCTRMGMARLRGLHCYDVFAGAETMQEIFAKDAGTYVLTDFLLQSFRRTVLNELGLDRRPELWADYFGNYTQVVWLAQHRSELLEAQARDVAAMFHLPLTILEVGVGALELQLEELLDSARAPYRPGRPIARPRNPGEAACAAG